MLTTTDADLEARKGSPSPRLPEDEFERRFMNRFRDAAYQTLSKELAKVTEAAWNASGGSRKSLQSRNAGPTFHDAHHYLSVEWLPAREAIRAAYERHDDRFGPLRFLLNSGPQLKGEIFDLSRIASEYGRRFPPCKAISNPASFRGSSTATARVRKMFADPYQTGGSRWTLSWPGRRLKVTATLAIGSPTPGAMLLAKRAKVFTTK
ncbi:hypothetical protein SB748_25550 [Rhizobium sp. SIMBA_035]